MNASQARVKTPSIVRVASWLAGLLALIWLIFFFGWADTLSLLGDLNFIFVFAWFLITILSRLVLVEALVRPLAQLGKPIRRGEGFWLGWARSFFNQLLPLSGVGYFSGYLKAKTALSWSAVATLSSPQLLFASIAIGLLGVGSTFMRWGQLGSSGWLILGSFLLALLGPIGLLLISQRFLTILPYRLQQYAKSFRTAWAKLHASLPLLVSFLAVHICAVLLRALRLWILFLASNSPPDLISILLISCAGEVILLLQVTPGGIGLKEGTLVGMGALIGMDVKTVAGIAIIDRLLIVAMVTAMAPLAFWQLNRIDKTERGG